MRRLILAAALAVFAIPSFAADLPTKAPYQPGAELFNWSGIYIGGHASGIWGNVAPEAIGVPSGKPTGWGGGAQLEGLYQLRSGLVVGVVTDIDLSSVKGNLAGGLANVSGDLSGTLRAKLGYAGFANGWLPYLTAGIAGQKTNVKIATIKTQDTSWGWIAGAGMEVALVNNWSVYGEYLYFGDANGQFCFGGACIGAKINDQVVRGGLNYRFAL